MNTDLTGLRKFFGVGFTLIVLMCLGGCRTINIGGSGSIGVVRGSGGISIPVPNK